MLGCRKHCRFNDCKTIRSSITYRYRLHVSGRICHPHCQQWSRVLLSMDEWDQCIKWKNKSNPFREHTGRLSCGRHAKRMPEKWLGLIINISQRCFNKSIRNIPRLSPQFIFLNWNRYPFPRLNGYNHNVIIAARGKPLGGLGREKINVTVHLTASLSAMFVRSAALSAR